MASYERQMQWRKAASEKAKKHYEERVAESAHSFAPVFYTHASSKSTKDNRTHDEEIHHASSKSQSRSQRSKDGSTTQQNNNNNNNHGNGSAYRDSDAVYSSPVGASSINSHAHSQYSEGPTAMVDAYSSSYAEMHQQEHASHRPGGSGSGSGHRQSQHRASSGRNQRSDRVAGRHTHDIAEGDDEQASQSAEDSTHNRGSSNRHSHAPSSSAAGQYSSNGRHQSHRSEEKRRSPSENHSRHHRHHRHHEDTRNRSASSPTRSGSASSSASSSGEQEVRDRRRRSGHMRTAQGHRKRMGSSEDSVGEAEEPIIELLERERKQWREERQQLIQCIHLQQLELTQRSTAAHERAADIAKEFARAIECFEERLVNVEGTVQKEIMSIKSIGEALLHAATTSASAAANSNGSSSAGIAGSGTGLGTQQRPV